MFYDRIYQRVHLMHVGANPHGPHTYRGNNNRNNGDPLFIYLFTFCFRVCGYPQSSVNLHRER